MKIYLAILLLFISFSCSTKTESKESSMLDAPETEIAEVKDSLNFYQKLSEAAISIIDNTIIYDPNYQSIAYPNGDVAPNKGVCTDVVIRAYRKLGIDLQKEVHEDISANFNKYPNQQRWGLSKPDRNIDHRRVPNLQVFFVRFGKELPITKNKDDYLPGDMVVWDLGGGILHIGIVIDKKTSSGTPLVVHNIGRGQIMEDILFRATIIGHYRYGDAKEN